MKLFTIKMNQTIERQQQKPYFRITNVRIGTSIWVRYVGKNTFTNVYADDLADPAVIPGIFCMVGVSKSFDEDTQWAFSTADNYAVIYYKDKMFLYDTVISIVVAIIDDNTTLKKILNAIRNGKVQFSKAFKIKIDGVCVRDANYLDLF